MKEDIRLEADETSLWIRSLRPNELSAKGNTPPSAWWPMILSVFINDHKSDKIPQARPKCRLSYETDGRSEIPKTEKSWSFVAEMVPILYTFPGPTTAAATQIELWYEEVNTSARYAAARSLIA